MNAIAEADGTTGWRFKLGQCISHKDQSMPSLVMGRVRTTKGREVYGLRSFMNVDPNRGRSWRIAWSTSCQAAGHV